MLKGSRDAVLHRMQPVSIHGQLFYDLHYRFVDEPDSFESMIGRLLQLSASVPQQRSIEKAVGKVGFRFG